MLNGANPLDSAEFTLNCKYVFAFVKVRKIRFIWLLISKNKTQFKNSMLSYFYGFLLTIFAAKNINSSIS